MREKLEDFIQILIKQAQESTCRKMKVGALIIRGNEIISRGSNTAPGCLKDCIENGCDIVNNHCVRTIHAEQVAIINALSSCKELNNSILLVTHHPCVNCAKLIIEVGIGKVFYLYNYDDFYAKKYLKEAKIEINKIR